MCGDLYKFTKNKEHHYFEFIIEYILCTRYNASIFKY